MSIETILIWILLGAVAGWLAGVVVKGGGFGLGGNIAIGIIGSFFGGWLGGKLNIAGASTGGFSLSSILTAFFGAVVLLFIISLIRRVV